MAPSRENIAIIGSGNWGSAVARIIGLNVAKSNEFDSCVKMWVYEETLDGRLLTDIINKTHENTKYLPGVRLPDNVVAIASLEDTVRDATLLVFVVPHQFVGRLCEQMAPVIKANARAISLIKGLDLCGDGKLRLVSDHIRARLGIDVCVLMGANIASEVAADEFSEATIGGRNAKNVAQFARLFDRPSFVVNTLDSHVPVELCGALKNIVGVASGIVEGLGKGNNTRAAVIRIGFKEMISFCCKLFEETPLETFLESCGIADVIATCYGGRNQRAGAELVRTGKTLAQIEADMNGQHLQGPLTAREVHIMLQHHELTKDFPLFNTVYRICYEGLSPQRFFDNLYHFKEKQGGGAI